MAEERVQRRLAAILAADVVGYSRMMEADEAGTLARVKALRAELLHPKIAEYGGRIVKTTGDGTLVEFPSAVDAVGHALDVQAALARRNYGVAEGERIELRIGINLGDIIVEGDDIFGDGVNVAARLEALAEPGGICISGTVREQVRNKLDAAFEDLGEQAVKNIARPVRVYRVAPGGAGTPASGAPIEALLRLPSIAVLPFANMSGDAEQEYFSDGVAEDLITALSQVRQFRVVARNSTFSYKGRSPDIRTVAKELGVRYVIEGSVRKSANRIRLTAQLIDGATGEHLWSQRYDRDLSDVFAVQDELTASVVGALEPELGKAEIERARTKTPESLDAWDLYQRGTWHFNRRTRDDVAEARKYYRRAIELNPGFGPAYSGLSQSIIYEVLVGVRDVRSGDSQEAIDTARRAVEIDDTDAWSWSWLGRAYAFGRNHEEAISTYRKAIDLDPCYALAYYHLAASLTLSDRASEAIEHFQTALRLSPQDPWAGSIMGRMAEAYLTMERYEEAVRWGREATRQPGPGANLWTNRIAMVSALAYLGREDDARRELEGLDRVQPGISLTFVRQHFPAADDSPFMRRLLGGLRKAGLPE